MQLSAQYSTRAKLFVFSELSWFFTVTISVFIAFLPRAIIHYNFRLTSAFFVNLRTEDDEGIHDFNTITIQSVLAMILPTWQRPDDSFIGKGMPSCFINKIKQCSILSDVLLCLPGDFRSRSRATIEARLSIGGVDAEKQ